MLSKNLINHHEQTSNLYKLLKDMKIVSESDHFECGLNPRTIECHLRLNCSNKCYLESDHY